VKIDPVALTLSYHDAMNREDLAAMEAMYAEDAEYSSPGIKGYIKGRANIMKAMRAYFAEFSGQAAEDEKVELIAPLTVRSSWRLQATTKSSGRVVRRHGFETIVFTPKGLIQSVDVEDVLPVT
jgi:ketosteroid isomerase-like protein